MTRTIRVQVSDEVAAEMVEEMKAGDCWPWAACVEVLLRDRGEARAALASRGEPAAQPEEVMPVTDERTNLAKKIISGTDAAEQPVTPEESRGCIASGAASTSPLAAPDDWATVLTERPTTIKHHAWPATDDNLIGEFIELTVEERDSLTAEIARLRADSHAKTEKLRRIIFFHRGCPGQVEMFDGRWRDCDICAALAVTRS